MQRRDVAKDSDSCPECGARFITPPCRSCNGTGHSLLLFKCRTCRGTGKKTVCPNFLSHLRNQSRPQSSLPNHRDIDAMRKDGDTEAAEGMGSGFPHELKSRI